MKKLVVGAIVCGIAFLTVYVAARYVGATEVGIGLNLDAEVLPDDSDLVTTECRDVSQSIQPMHKFVIDCDDTVTLPDPPESLVESIVGAVNGDVTASYTITVSAVDDVITMTIQPPLADQDTYTITLSPSVIEGDNDFMIRILVADVNGDKIVWPNDRSAIPPRYGSDVTVDDNCRYDITCDGNIWPNDRSAVPPRYGNSAP